MDKFIRKLNFDFATNQKVLQLIGYIDGFKGKWNIAKNQPLKVSDWARQFPQTQLSI